MQIDSPDCSALQWGAGLLCLFDQYKVVGNEDKIYIHCTDAHMI